MLPARRGILLGLGFTLEALKAAGLTDEQLDAPAAPVLDARGAGSTGIYDVEFQEERTQIDVTSFMDDGPRYVPGIKRASVRFKVGEAAVESWVASIFNGEPVEFNEQVGDVRVSCKVQVIEVTPQVSVDGPYTCTVRARVVGEPTITRTVPRAAPPKEKPQVKDRGRRAVKLGGDRLLID